MVTYSQLTDCDYFKWCCHISAFICCISLFNLYITRDLFFEGDLAKIAHH